MSPRRKTMRGRVEDTVGEGRGEERGERGRRGHYEDDERDKMGL